MIEKREQFLKNTFESLGGTEKNFENDNHHFPSMFKFKNQLFSIHFYPMYLILGKKSISSQYKETNSESTLQHNTNTESQRKRKELQQRIEETRRTLQNVCSFSYSYI